MKTYRTIMDFILTHLIFWFLSVNVFVILVIFVICPESLNIRNSLVLLSLWLIDLIRIIKIARKVNKRAKDRVER